METTTEFRAILSRELHTEDLNLEHDTVVVTPEAARRIMEALRLTRECVGVSDSATPAIS